MSDGRSSSGTERPEVVCLCGSTRFKDEYRAENRRLTMEGKIVLSVGLFGHADGHEFTDQEKEMLDALHKRKIDLADRIHVINVDGYIGDSTQSEIAYARETGTEVSHLEQPAVTDGGTAEDGTDRTADEWERYLEENSDEVLMFIDGDYEIHTFEHEPEKGELCLLKGGTYGYDYEGSRASLEAFAEDDSDAHKLVPRDEEYAERKRLTDGEYDTPQEWAERTLQAATDSNGGSRDR